MHKQIVIAIDPGTSGATTVQYSDGKVFAYGFKSESEQKELIKNIKVSAAESNSRVVAYIEQVGGFTGHNQPGSAMFNFGRNFGYHLALLDSAGFEVHLVRPQEWQKGLPKTPKLADRAAAKRKHKNDLKEVAARLFPHISVTLKNADALLILNYAQKK